MPYIGPSLACAMHICSRVPTEGLTKLSQHDYFTVRPRNGILAVRYLCKAAVTHVHNFERASTPCAFKKALQACLCNLV